MLCRSSGQSGRAPFWSVVLLPLCGGSGPWHTSCSEGGTELLDQLPPHPSALELRMHRHTHLKVRTAVVNDGNAVVSPFGWKGRYHVVSNHVKLIHTSQFAQTSDFRNVKTFDPNRPSVVRPNGRLVRPSRPAKGRLSHISRALPSRSLPGDTPRTPGATRRRAGVRDARLFRTSSNPGDLVTCQIRKTNDSGYSTQWWWES